MYIVYVYTYIPIYVCLSHRYWTFFSFFNFFYSVIEYIFFFFAIFPYSRLFTSHTTLCSYMYLYIYVYIYVYMCVLLSLLYVYIYIYKKAQPAVGLLRRVLAQPLTLNYSFLLFPITRRVLIAVMYVYIFWFFFLLLLSFFIPTHSILCSFVHCIAINIKRL